MRLAVALLLLLGALCAPAAGQRALPDQASILLDFAAITRGDNRAALANWHAGSEPCGWVGITCSAGGVVTAIRLPRMGLRGTLDPNLARLTTLQQIDLSGNELQGRLPGRWARLDSLERLRLDANALTGPLPAGWNTIEGIQHLSLADNRLNGSLPAAWSSMGRLVSLDLSGNALSGPLPAPWARQHWLIHLGLARNSFSGGLPREWGGFSSLLTLSLAGNKLTGSLPVEWGALQEATAIDLSGNALAGPLPPAWGRLASVQMLSLQGNQLSGAVPAEWSDLASRAFRITLGDNPSLCGAVPSPLAPSILAAGSSAKGSGLASPCSWEGDAKALLALKAAAVADTPGSPLADWLPQANPCSAGAWSGVSCQGGRVSSLNLANAGLRLSSLEPLAGLGALQKLLLARNSAVNATLPASWAGLTQLAVLDLSGTGVVGGLPEEWAAMRSLHTLLLGGNSLNGTLPAAWAQLEGLTTLNLAQNGLTGPLPAQWGSLASLASLDASSNYLSGPLPYSWSNLDSLQELHLANNNLGGPVPMLWAELPSLALLDLGSNVGVCGGQPPWRAGTQVRTNATNIDQSCIMIETSGIVAGAVLGASLGLTVASLAATAALLVYVRRQRQQLALLQRERSASFTSLQLHPSFSAGGSRPSAAVPNSGAEVDNKLATLHSFEAMAGQAAGGQARQHPKLAKALSIIPTWTDEHSGYIQVPLATPGPAPTPARFAVPGNVEEHRSPSPTPGMPSPERHQWQVAAAAADRGVDLHARRARQRSLFRSRSDISSAQPSAGDEATAAVPQGQLEQWSSQEEGVDMLRAHSRIALLRPGDRDGSSMV